MEYDSILGTIFLWCSIAAIWLSGESGRVLVAAGLGGLVRWFNSEKRRVRDGIAAVVGGCISGIYLWPIVLWALSMDHTSHSIAMASFVAGTLGMSFVKIITAVVEAKVKKSVGHEDETT